MLFFGNHSRRKKTRSREKGVKMEMMEIGT